MSVASKLTARWHQLPLEQAYKAASLDAVSAQRSSHGIAAYRTPATAGGLRILVFGGEHKPRIPCDAGLLDVSATPTSASAVNRQPPPSAASTAAWPAARVGAPLALLDGCAYLWGGRGGVAMSPLATPGDGEDVWRYAASSDTWEKLSTSGAKPSGTSYHCMAAQGGGGAQPTLWLHAGCPASGRLASLHSLDVASLTWSAHPDAPGAGRGGTSITYSDAPTPRLLRWGGFCGHELAGPLAVYDIAQRTWKEYDCLVLGQAGSTGPPARSVYALHALPTPTPAPQLALDVDGQAWTPVAVLSHGEGEGAPKELGHAGAGKFLADTWVLVHSQSAGAGAGAEQYAWVAPSFPTGEAVPEPRGWFASAALEGEGGEGSAPGTLGQVVLHGGLNEENQRLGDAWVLTLAVE